MCRFFGPFNRCCFHLTLRLLDFLLSHCSLTIFNCQRQCAPLLWSTNYLYQNNPHTHSTVLPSVTLSKGYGCSLELLFHNNDFGAGEVAKTSCSVADSVLQLLGYCRAVIFLYQRNDYICTDLS